MGVNYSPKVVTNGLIGCWDAGNTKSYPGSGSTWYDLSGRGNNGTITGTTYSSGTLVFNGTTDQVSCPTYATMAGGNFANAITIDMWMKINNPPTNSLMGYCGFTQASPAVAFKFMNTTNLFLDTYDTTNTRYITNNILTIANYYGIWFHVCGVYDGTAKAYQNGVLQNTSASYTQADISSLNFLIGNGMGYYNFMGSMAQVKVYSRALNASEVAQNFNALRGRYGL